MRLTLTHRTAARPEDEPPDAEALKKPEMLFAGCRTAELPLYFAGPEADAVALYEQIFAHCRGIYFRYLDAFGDPVVRPAPAGVPAAGRLRARGCAVSQRHIGCSRASICCASFSCFRASFSAASLTGLDTVLPQLKAKTIDIVFAFDEVNARLAAAVQPSMFALYAAPAINLFEKTTDRIPLKSNQHEYHVVPDRSHYLDYRAASRCWRCTRTIPAGGKRCRCGRSIRRRSRGRKTASGRRFYTVRRLPRRRTVEEKRSACPRITPAPTCSFP